MAQNRNALLAFVREDLIASAAGARASGLAPARVLGFAILGTCATRAAAAAGGFCITGR